MPDWSCCVPSSTLRKLVLPLPLGPRTAKNSPGLMSRSRSRHSSLFPKDRAAPRRLTMGSNVGDPRSVRGCTDYLRTRDYLKDPGPAASGGLFPQGLADVFNVACHPLHVIGALGQGFAETH